ncbi:MAG: hypothetical protein MJ252_01350 [archaeon]|nr:hypothetical protein [archaeon]
MSNVNELKEALKETLEEKGILNQVRAMMRQSIFEAIESNDKPKPKLSDENLIINELIREYLIYNNYLHSNSVFIAESGQPGEPPFDRSFIAKELNIVEDSSSRKVPLLYSILFGLKKEFYQPNEMQNQGGNFNPNINSNMNPMNMVDNSNIGMVSQSQKRIEQNPQTGIMTGNQPQPWVLDNN